MFRLKNLKDTTSRKDLAVLLGFKPKMFSYILYKKQDDAKYNKFEIQKRTGGVRTISAPSPDLKSLQSRLSDLLQDCVGEINKEKGIRSVLSHGFRRQYSILTNAAVHKRKRYVFNIDLEDFFGTINFGRVRGYFMKNQNFQLAEPVATAIAKIACFENALPQGSPCSPIISNLVAHVLDIRLAKLAHRTSCQYSRYADDLTFSTNKFEFPSEVAGLVDGEDYRWEPGSELFHIIDKAGFSINPPKTRMQLAESRQDVTGLVVNNKVNTRVEYRRTARAMTHRLLTTGEYYRKRTSIDKDGNEVITEDEGSIGELNGILNFINSPTMNRIETFLENIRKEGEDQKKLDSKEVLKEFPLGLNEAVYGDFLFYRDFHAPTAPLIVCEGKTDNIYLRAAVRQKADKYPLLAEAPKGEPINVKVRFYKYSNTTTRILHLSGGIGDLCKILSLFKRIGKRISAPHSKFPVILFTDNDSGAKGNGGIYQKIKPALGDKPDGKDPFYILGENLYVVPTSLKPDGGDTVIEDFFDDDVKATKLGGKSFNPTKHRFDSRTEYGKYVFAEQVVRKNQDKINFDGFEPILDRIQLVIEEHLKKLAA